MATTLAWNAVGLCVSSCVTCRTGHTSRQNLWPELKQLYAAFRHSSTSRSVEPEAPFPSAVTRTSDPSLAEGAASITPGCRRR